MKFNYGCNVPVSLPELRYMRGIGDAGATTFASNARHTRNLTIRVNMGVPRRLGLAHCYDGAL